MTATVTHWRDHAACLGTDLDLFFPPGTSWEGHRDQADQARAICARCPVIAECLADAIERREPYAIAGGMTPSQRDYVKRKARR